MTARSPLRNVLVQRNLVDSVSSAEAHIAAGEVLVNGSVAMSGAHLVSPSDAVLIRRQARFVSRGGEKLQAAIEHFGINMNGATVLDAGSSTGGFSDCALQAGAAHVTALDVGSGLLHERVATSERVTMVENYNVRRLTEENSHDGNPASLIRPEYDFVVADLSFISLTTVADALCSKVAPSGQMILLVKPQFEATKAEVDKSSGVITDPAVHERTCKTVGACYGERGFSQRGIMASPLLGASGNTEFLLLLSRL